MTMTNELEPAPPPPRSSLRASLRFDPPHPLLNTPSGHTYCAHELFKAHGVRSPDFVDVSGHDHWQFITMCRWVGPEPGIAVSRALYGPSYFD